MGDGESALRFRLLAVPAAASIVRERLRHWLDGLGWPEPELDDVVLAVHEAVSNSVEHGYADTEAGEVE
ncbi:MAG: ATP-binding protein, partial [Pseudonocardia sp.]|nr:ATP-binding protein [Pseudonocardia sp.]